MSGSLENNPNQSGSDGVRPPESPLPHTPVNLLHEANKNTNILK